MAGDEYSDPYQKTDLATNSNDVPPYQQYQNFAGQNTGVPQYGSDAGSLSQQLCTKERPCSPSELELMPMAQTVHSEYEEKEVVIPSIAPEQYHLPGAVENNAVRPQRRRLCGKPTVWLWIIVAAILILGVALGVGLGVGLHQDNSESSSADAGVNTTYMIGGSINPQYYSDEGAFNGSGIALASQSFSRELADGTQGNLVMYYQHWTGQIRYKQLANDGTWKGGDISAVVVQDARNNTPLSAVSYVLHSASTWHVFYIDQNDTVKQRSNSNTTNVWADGPINKLNLKAYDSEMVGMQACYYGNEYGDSDYIHTPLSNEDPTANRSTEIGMHMWYASSESTFEQYGWRDGDSSWQHQLTWNNLNGHAGVGCYSWGPGTVTYVMFVNLQNTVEFYWRDTNTTLTNSTSHPINEWTKTSIAINNVYPASSLGYTNYFYAQDEASLKFKGYNISWAAEDTTIVQQDTFPVQGEPGLPGTHLSVSAIPKNSGGSDVVVFYQTNGSDITEYTRDLYAGQWSEIDVPLVK